MGVRGGGYLSSLYRLPAPISKGFKMIENPDGLCNAKIQETGLAFLQLKSCCLRGWHRGRPEPGWSFGATRLIGGSSGLIVLLILVLEVESQPPED